MAVTGDLGGQTINLENAAEEATLKKILDLMQDGDTKFDDANDEVKKFGDEVKKTAKTTQNVEGSFDELERTAKKTKSGLEKFSEGLLSQSKAIARSFKGATSGTDGFISVVQDVIGSIGDALGSIPGIGGILKGVAAGVSAGFGFLMGAAQKTTDAFTALADTGATFGNSMIAMRDAAHSAGIPLETFAKAVSSNISGLTRFAGSASAGARALSDAQRAIKDQGLEKSLMMMGVALKDQPEFMGEYINQLAASGIGLSQFSGRFDELARMAVNYRKELVIARQLTGESNEEQKARMRAAQKDAQIQAKLRTMSAEEVEGFNQILAATPAALQPAVKDMLLFNNVTKDSAHLMAMYPAQVGAIQESMQNVAAGAGGLRSAQESRMSEIQSEINSAGEMAMIAAQSSSEMIKKGADAFVEMAGYSDRLARGMKGIVDETEQAATGIGADELTDNMMEFQIATRDMTVAIENLTTEFLKEKGFNFVIKALVEGLRYIADQIGKDGSDSKLTGEKREQAATELGRTSKGAQAAAERAEKLKDETNIFGTQHAASREAQQMLQRQIRKLEQDIKLNRPLLGENSEEIKAEEAKLSDLKKQLQSMTKRQYGGPVIPGKRYIVGESGPELFESDEVGEIQNNNVVRSQVSPQGTTTGMNEALMEHLKRSNELMERLVDINKRGFDDEATMLQRIAAN